MSETEPLAEVAPDEAPEDSGFLLRDAFWLIFGYLGSQIFTVGIIVFIDVLRHGRSGVSITSTADGLNRLAMVGCIVATVVVLLMLRRIARRRGAGAVAAAFGLVWPGSRWFGAAFLVFIALQASIRGLTVLAGDDIVRQGLQTMNGIISSDPLWNAVSALMVILVLPVLEELIFRAVLFRALSRHMPQIAAAVLAVVIFAAIHLQYVLAGGQVALLMTFEIVLLGSGLMWLYLKSGSILPSICVHVANNGLAFLALVIFS
jgi:membrane protease YdiL (CAAX protease family)